MAQVYSPTPHRIALCALARHLNYHPEDEDVELEGRARRDDGTRVLRARDRHALSRLLMEEATSTDGFREPTLRALQSRLDAFSRADGAPPAFPDDVVVDVHDEDFLSLADRDPDGRVNLKNLLRESLGVIRNVDDLVRLFRDVEPRSAHAAVMRGDVDDYFGDPTWPSPVDPDSIVGVFLRRCCVDFDRLSFEGACKVQSVFAHYVREGEGAYDTLEKDADGISTRDLGDATRRGLRADAAAGDADDAAAEAFASGGAPSHPFDPRGLADVGVRTPAALVAHVARHIHGAVSDVGRTAPGDVAARLDDVAAVAPNLPGAHLLRHLDALRAKDFPAAVDHLRRHFDTLAASDGADDPVRSSVSVGSTPRPGAGSNAVAGSTDAAAGRERLQSALLALGVAHASFAHGAEALKALNEAVRTAQQNGDESSLAPRRGGVRRALRVRGGTARERGGKPRGRSRTRSGNPRRISRRRRGRGRGCGRAGRRGRVRGGGGSETVTSEVSLAGEGARAAAPRRVRRVGARETRRDATTARGRGRERKRVGSESRRRGRRRTRGDLGVASHRGIGSARRRRRRRANRRIAQTRRRHMRRRAAHGRRRSRRRRRRRRARRLRRVPRAPRRRCRRRPPPRRASMRQLTGAGVRARGRHVGCARRPRDGARVRSPTSPLRRVRTRRTEGQFERRGNSRRRILLDEFFLSVGSYEHGGGGGGHGVRVGVPRAPAAVEHGPSAASATLATASHRFPREDSDALAAAAHRCAPRRRREATFEARVAQPPRSPRSRPRLSP